MERDTLGSVFGEETETVGKEMVQHQPSYFERDVPLPPRGVEIVLGNISTTEMIKLAKGPKVSGAWVTRADVEGNLHWNLERIADEQR